MIPSSFAQHLDNGPLVAHPLWAVMSEEAIQELSQHLEELIPLLAQAVVRQLYADEWVDIHQVVKMVKISRSRLDELKAVGEFPRADRWVAGKQVWCRLTVEEWKETLSTSDLDRPSPSGAARTEE